MKPSWKDAPAWANWLAMDRSGKWTWFENQPATTRTLWVCDGEYQEVTNVNWTETLEPRPGETK